MSKFKVGDKVKFIGNVSEHIFNDILDNHKDSLIICKVCRGKKSYQVQPLGINDTTWCFDDDELELLEENKLSFDFKLPPELEWENRDIKPVYIKGIKEEKEMNKVLNLWFERKQEKIIKKYAEMEQDFINNHYSVVKSYNDLVEQFEKDLDDLYKLDKVNEQFVLEEISDKNTIKYDIDFDKLSCEFTDKHIKEKQGELKELAKIREEVEAQLSLSNELKYQQDVLIQYNIIDKKTKKIVE